jgi:hypothetical protein
MLLDEVIPRAQIHDVILAGKIQEAVAQNHGKQQAQPEEDNHICIQIRK